MIRQSTNLCALAAGLLAISAGFALSSLAAAPVRGTAGNDVAIQMKDVNFRLAENIALEVRSLRGTLHSTNPAVPVTFDDVNSFEVEVDTAEVAISPAELTTLMNSRARLRAIADQERQHGDCRRPCQTKGDHP